MGLAVSGSGFGMMFIPPLLDYYIALVNPQLAVSPSLSLSGFYTDSKLYWI
jgi:hypothetical protein